MRGREVLRTGGDSGSQSGQGGAGQHKEDVMRKLRLVVLAMLVVLPFAVMANAQVGVGIGVGPAVVDPGYYGGYYGPPDCEWGYYSYYPYACAPYGYYGPDWFYGGVFIGAGPWYGWGWGHGWGRGGWGRGGWGYGHGGYGYGGRGGYGYGGRGGYGTVDAAMLAAAWRVVMPAAA